MKDYKFHYKTAFSLYLNQAIHNFETALKDVDVENAKRTKEIIRNLSIANINALTEKYFNFLRLRNDHKIFEDISSHISDKERACEIAEIKKKILLLVYERLNNFRNFYSHYYAKPISRDKNIFAILEGTDEEKYLKNFLEYRYKDAQEIMIEKYQNSDDKYTEDDFKELNSDDKWNMLFNYNFENKNYYFDNGERKFKYKNHKAILFLASFFLDERQMNLFMSQIKGFKRTSEKNFKVTRECFTTFCMVADSAFKSEDRYVRFFVDAFTHLSKTPKVVVENMNDGVITISYEALRKVKDDIFEAIGGDLKNDRINKNQKEKIIEKVQKTQAVFDGLKDKSYVNKFKAEQEIISEIEQDIKNIDKNINFKQFVNQLLDYVAKDIQIRTSRDRFTDFALQYINDFDLFKNIKFKVYTGRVLQIEHEKTYHGGTTFDRYYHKPETAFASISEILDGSFELPKINTEEYKNERNASSKSRKIISVELLDRNETMRSPKYFIKNNNVFFEVKVDDFKQTCSVSVHELKNIIFALHAGEEVENEIIKYVKKYRNLLNSIKAGENPEDIELKLPQSIKNYLHKPDATQLYKKKIISRLEYINNVVKENKSNIKTLRKYDKIEQIIKYVNRFSSELRSEKRGYLNVEQHQELEILLGNFPVSKIDLEYFFDDNEINTQFTKNKDNPDSLNYQTKDIKNLLNEKNDLNAVLYKVYAEYEKWTKKAINKIQKTDNPKILKQIGRVINVAEPDCSLDRIKYNIENILSKNIVIPRGFVRKYVFVNQSVSEIINNKVADDTACIYHSKMKDLFADAKNESDKKEKRKIYNLIHTYNETKLKDKVLYLMAKAYLDVKILKGKGAASDLSVSNEIGNILKEGMHMEVGKYKIIFGLNEFDRIFTVINDKRIKKIIKFYLNDQKEVHYIQKNKYEEKQKEDNKDKIYDIQDAIDRVEREQMLIIDGVLKNEESILFEYLCKEARKRNIETKYIERYIDKTEKEKVLNKDEFNEFKNKYREKIYEIIEPIMKDDNRVETKKLFQIKKVNNKKKILMYRNSAFHNGLPDNGSYEAGIELINGI